ncbi:mannose-1-phosphate guanylyltransferase/mannose-6-phosphate isomerase [Sphingobium sp. AS12]|uniref:mannose-1-phosphate guanylyltransferase/mannose-6-phosphate isomerase n=1 Tax=Sphingobium sp. AS12 TaxID=2849495 RepID=UPI001C312872|nr:mannose-1-phosphate guanylyltransferase/mannose-6-phosphate isomerase [Sphingobium sp. AS12]MBV2149181.1 mannose-1-phosphate guanylyltransferase/mannose-6-phosphate isomerase [Sphingobium sp. AS12]
MVSDLMHIVPVILSGGSGTRLWPVSKPERPKQLLPLTADETMLQLTAVRTRGFSAASIIRPILVSNAAHADIIDEQLQQSNIDDYSVILEPIGRNTAPAIALAALEAQPSDALLVMPSDHVIDDLPAFHDAITRALPLVAQGWLITFGIEPDGPETGYGYIQMGQACGDLVNKVVRFVEKPDVANAERMLAEGNHAWNAGIFLFRADAYLAALERHQPDMMAAVRASMTQAKRDGPHIFPDAMAFHACPSDSVDYAIMERETQVACVPVAMGWSDVGSWDSLHAVSTRCTDENAVRGDALLLGARNCLVHSDGPRVTLVDVDDLIVVVSQGEVMILKRGESQKVRKVTEALKALAAATSSH